MKVLLLTGAPGVGKTTVIRNIAAALPDRRLAGFYTEEIRETGERQGFRIVGFDGQEKVMARQDFPGPLRVGRYGVDLAAIEAVVGLDLGLDRPADVYLVDEIGKMECLCEEFITAMRAVLASGTPVITTVALHGEGFIEEVKRLPGVRLLEVTRSNRERVPREALTWLQEALGSDQDCRANPR